MMRSTSARATTPAFRGGDGRRRWMRTTAVTSIDRIELDHRANPTSETDVDPGRLDGVDLSSRDGDRGRTTVAAPFTAPQLRGRVHTSIRNDAVFGRRGAEPDRNARHQQRPAGRERFARRALMASPSAAHRRPTRHREPPGGTDGVDLRRIENDYIDARDGFQDRIQCGEGADPALPRPVRHPVWLRVRDHRGAAGGRGRRGRAGLHHHQGQEELRPERFLQGLPDHRDLQRGERRCWCSCTGPSLEEGLFSKTADVVLVEKTVTLTGASTTVKVKPPKKVKRRVRKKGFRARVKVEARDQYGDRWVERRS